MSRIPWILLLVAASAGADDHAASCRAASGALTRPLVELYTSEGCDSCPPADRWLAARFAATPGAEGAVAIAFHVDYWDRLGWADRFASAAYTERQYDAMRSNGATFVFTPQVLLQGHDFAGWRSGVAGIDTAARAPARTSLALEAQPDARSVVVHADARVSDPAAAHDARLFVAYVDNGLVSEVTAGENHGVRLTHDHVVRVFRATGAAGVDGRVRATVTLPKPREAGSHPAIVAFVQRTTTGDVLQTLPLALDHCGPS